MKNPGEADEGGRERMSRAFFFWTISLNGETNQQLAALMGEELFPPPPKRVGNCQDIRTDPATLVKTNPLRED